MSKIVLHKVVEIFCVSVSEDGIPMRRTMTEFSFVIQDSV